MSSQGAQNGPHYQEHDQGHQEGRDDDGAFQELSLPPLGWAVGGVALVPAAHDVGATEGDQSGNDDGDDLGENLRGGDRQKRILERAGQGALTHSGPGSAGSPGG